MWSRLDGMENDLPHVGVGGALSNAMSHVLVGNLKKCVYVQIILLLHN